jgi:calcineurin-like phosphoesterase family protein
MLLGIALISIVFVGTTASTAAAADPVIAAAGDISCNTATVRPSSCHQQAVSSLLLGHGLAAVLPLGDLQYESGTLDLFQRFYGPSWGRVKSITRPAVGNHEYNTSGATGYYSYFGAAAGPPDKGYYSYDVGSWHLIALNSNCSTVGCGSTSPQVQWLESDLASHRRSCTLAYWHHPHFSSGPHGDAGSTDDFWNTLYEGGADVVLSGHDHDYERFAPQTPLGKADPAYGIRQFVAGTGGRSHYAFAGIKPNSQVRNDDTFGVLEMTLRAASYSWRFVPEAGNTFTDSGTDTCHGAPGTGLVKLSGPSKARLSRTGSISVDALCATSCTARLRATVGVGGKTLRSRRTSRQLTPERRVKLKVKFSKRARRALRLALARHKRLRITVTAEARDLAGNVGKAKLKLRLRR